MDKRLLSDCIIAIPLKQIEGFSPLQPNFFVLQSQSGIVDSSIPSQDGSFELKKCVIAKYKLVKREILPEVDNRHEEYIERKIQDIESIHIPLDALLAISTHQAIKDNIELVNGLFSHFWFRGSLAGYILEVDENILDEILQPIGVDNLDFMPL